MHKSDLVSVVDKVYEFTQAQNGKVVDALLDAISRARKGRGDKVTLTDFGMFEVRKIAAGNTLK